MKLLRCLAISFITASLLSAAAVQAKTIVGVAHTQLETHPDHLGFVAFKNYVEKHAGDRYEVQIYPNKTAGANEKVIELVKAGTIQFMCISSANLEIYNPKYKVFSLPYMFSSEEKFEKLITSPDVIEELGENNDQDGFTPLAAYTAGTRSFYSKTPIKTIDDLKGKTFRVQAGQTNRDIMSFFGAEDITVPFGEVYKALKSGAADGAENNEIALVDQKHGEICKYYTYDRHQMCPDMIVGSSVFLYSIPEEDFDMFQKAALEAQKVEFSKWKESIDNAKKKAKEMGVTFIDVDINEFRKKVHPVHKHVLDQFPQIREFYKKVSTFNAAN